MDTFRNILNINLSSLIVLCVGSDSSRAKRICVAERRQPYSGADWCSGGESDEDDKGFFSKCVNMCVQACAAVPPLISLMHDSSSVGPKAMV